MTIGDAEYVGVASIDGWGAYYIGRSTLRGETEFVLKRADRKRESSLYLV